VPAGPAAAGFLRREFSTTEPAVPRRRDLPSSTQAGQRLADAIELVRAFDDAGAAA
jgi:hypothetical protein